MNYFQTSLTTSNSTDYREFRRYYNACFHYEATPPDKDKIVIKVPQASPKKEKVHIFDPKDLFL